jgi:hypothetical protein
VVVTAACPAPDPRSWTELYRNAFLEIDRNKLLERIAAAEEALAARSRELFHDRADNIDEEHALDDALYALKALRDAVDAGRMHSTN